MGLVAEGMLGRGIFKGKRTEYSKQRNTLSCIHVFVNWVDKRKMLRKYGITALTHSKVTETYILQI